MSTKRYSNEMIRISKRLCTTISSAKTSKLRDRSFHIKSFVCSTIKDGFQVLHRNRIFPIVHIADEYTWRIFCSNTKANVFLARFNSIKTSSMKNSRREKL